MKSALVLSVGIQVGILIVCMASSNAYAAPDCSANDPNCQPQSCHTESHACAGSACTNGCCVAKPLQGRVTTDVAARLSAGNEAAKRGHLETAANCYQYVLRQDPHNAEALYGTGYLAEKNGQLPHAAFFYRMAAINDPGNPHYRASLVAVQRQMNIPVVPVSMPAQPAPTMTAGQAPCPNLCVATQATQKQTSKTGKFFKAAAKIGAAAALSAASSGGLHCPVCRILK